ncbi:hypothetical protein E4U61_005332 [Claviceps capensis]|nr:hypothetical protein E4U61_005332 [Claviceps capensis]
MYEMSTALHFAVFLGNMRLTKTLLDMKASLEIPCSNLLRELLGSEEVLQRVSYFHSVFWSLRFGSAFPIFLACIQSHSDMCKLLVDHGAGREAMIVYLHGDPKAMSILHFPAADPTTDYRQCTPLHVALINGCIQGMQIAVESGADKESKNGVLHTPLSSGIRVLPYLLIVDPRPFEEHMRCLGKFVDLGDSINPDGDSFMGFAVQRYVLFRVQPPELRHLISFLVEHHADIDRPFKPNTNMIKEIIDGIYRHHNDPPSLESSKELLTDLVDRGLNLKISAPGLPSPLYRVLDIGNAEPEWLFDFLCKNGATIYEREEDEIFQKWCEHPHNAWWWQHAKQISPLVVSLAYGKSFQQNGQLYDVLAHLPLPRPLDDVLVKTAFVFLQPWSWRLVVLREFNEDFLATWSLNCGENMIHLTVCLFIEVGDYSAADATRDILHLRDKGVDMTSRNSNGKTPLGIFLERGSSKDGLMELAALLEGKVHKLPQGAGTGLRAR